MEKRLFFKKMRNCMSMFVICSMVMLPVLYVSCDDIYDNIKDFSVEEIVYPAHFDTIFATSGYERIEIDLFVAGRVPASQMKLGKAKKTIVEYDNETLEFDSLCSWVNITGLTQPRLYRFKVYTSDEYGNRSTPLEVTLTPYTSVDREALGVPNPNIAASSSSAVIEWAGGLTSAIMEYKGLSFSYTNKDGEKKTGTKWNRPEFFIYNLEAGQEVTVDVRYWVIPKVNGKNILDSVYFDQSLTLIMPSASAPFYPIEKEILEANGVHEFTAAGVAGITKLVYPVNATRSLLDIFYFPDLKELDLTGSVPMPTLTYNRNSVVSTVGGGDWSPCAVNNSSDNVGGAETLLTLLESGALEKVRYFPNTMGLNDILAPYVESGVVELIALPDEVLIPNQFNVDGRVQDNAFEIDLTYPATDAPNSEGLSEIYKVIVKQRAASFVFALPVNYRFNVAEYPYLKLKVYTPGKEAFSVNYGKYYLYNRLWFRFMNNMWAFASNAYPGAGQQIWNTIKGTYEIPDAYLLKWYDLTIDISNSKDTYNRVIIINIGEEASPSDWDPPLIQYYFANVRLSKNP
jgi:hypothetical protein